MNKHDIMYLKIASLIAEASYANKLKVGCIIVKKRSIISDGYNGTPSGFVNKCEDGEGLTYPFVLHAEANAIMKIASSNTDSSGSTIYITHAPCLECAKLIIQSNISNVIYIYNYKSLDGVKLLKKALINVKQISNI